VALKGPKVVAVEKKKKKKLKNKKEKRGEKLESVVRRLFGRTNDPVSELELLFCGI